MEIWKDVAGYEGRYMISTYGRVKSLIGNEKILSFRKNTSGYYIVSLARCNKPKSFLIHRLVAEAFIDNPKQLPYINHKDENKTNNHINNLEWCDAKYNANYGSNPHRLSVANKSNWTNISKPIVAIFPDGNVIEYNSIKTAAKKCGVLPSEIRRVIDKDNRSAKGIQFYSIKKNVDKHDFMWYNKAIR